LASGKSSNDQKQREQSWCIPEYTFKKNPLKKGESTKKKRKSAVLADWSRRGGISKSYSEPNQRENPQRLGVKAKKGPFSRKKKRESYKNQTKGEGFTVNKKSGGNALNREALWGKAGVTRNPVHLGGIPGG